MQSEAPRPTAAVDEQAMRQALEQAQIAESLAEVPVGAVVLHEGRIVAAAHNQRELLRDPTAHAEVLAITQAASSLGAWRLSGCTMYVTLEPCPMCAGALLQSRIDRVVYGADDPKAGAVNSLYSLLDDKRFNHTVEVTAGVLAEECGAILSRFFRARRGGKS